jgi:hypothetical protein
MASKTGRQEPSNTISTHGAEEINLGRHRREGVPPAVAHDDQQPHPERDMIVLVW